MVSLLVAEAFQSDAGEGGTSHPPLGAQGAPASSRGHRCPAPVLAQCPRPPPSRLHVDSAALILQRTQSHCRSSSSWFLDPGLPMLPDGSLCLGTASCAACDSSLGRSVSPATADKACGPGNAEEGSLPAPWASSARKCFLEPSVKRLYSYYLAKSSHSTRPAVIVSEQLVSACQGQALSWLPRRIFEQHSVLVLTELVAERERQTGANEQMDGSFARLPRVWEVCRAGVPEVSTLQTRHRKYELTADRHASSRRETRGRAARAEGPSPHVNVLAWTAPPRSREGQKSGRAWRGEMERMGVGGAEVT